MASFRTSAKTLMIGAALALPVALISATQARAEVVISVGFGPPALPVYAQPICPGDGFLWTPGYWAYGPDGYFWVPGTWVRPPQVGFLWTPGYWGWGGSAFIFHAGYWGPHIGFYGGINYGFGYGGVGYEGGYWRGGGFFYNRSVNNINVVSIHNVYEHPVVVRNAAFNHVSFNGGNGGIPVRASSEELRAAHEQHIQPTGEQMQHQNFASQNRAQFASVNHGRPGVTAAPTPSAFHANPGNPAARGGFGNTVNQRSANQQQRIANGTRSGEMTTGEAARADQRQANIDRQVHNDRTANGGALTGQERQQVNREQNGASRQIHNENHNGNATPRAQAEPRQQAQSRQQAAPRTETHSAPASHGGGGGGHAGGQHEGKPR
jgi:hypothetical protein